MSPDYPLNVTKCRRVRTWRTNMWSTDWFGMHCFQPDWNVQFCLQYFLFMVNSESDRCNIFPVKCFSYSRTKCPYGMKFHKVLRMLITKYLSATQTCDIIVNKICIFHITQDAIHEDQNFYAPGLKGPPGASSNQIVRPSVCLSVCLSVIPFRLRTKCNI